jgi:GNAT superfamily N-acetyltransferase
MTMEVRRADQNDAPSVQVLLLQLGYDIAEEEVRRRLIALSGQPVDPILLAVERDEILGLIALHWMPMLHLAKPMARITALVVRKEARGKGIGRILVEAGSEMAKREGCGLVEVTTALDRTDAHAFYKAIGFDVTSLKYLRSLNEVVSNEKR